ncbi:MULTISPECIES: DUF4350 domain-containing protein [unclassified Nostoc]|uniref:DUF4350 domain-containing protein n=1 Tax=unclassified Nostoc TaxID=2593658 RepID=UPI002AD219FF|nr:DUF4350 domain-containing protein [Nostoc sp. DedQUE03]MDZ7974270.1 DUF4350 domain-containing protein [Nostoc sp. DedQUE03]MDZ8043565.1 DUF4350 domain-containing protein [Nostoc sp. DedQUE02]
MKRSNRLAWMSAIALAAIVLLSLFAAPNNTKLNTGSTYNRAPDGYGAWYAFMQQQGTSIKRWQKPFSDIQLENNPVTLLQIGGHPRDTTLDSQEREWVEKGNTLVILGAPARVTEAEFSTMQKSPQGDIKIDTRRRYKKANSQQVDLGDRFGAVVWEESYKKGKVIFSTTPYLAANAYQDYLSNFKYLSSLVTQKSNTVFVDEYIHGYKDADVRKKESEGDLSSFFAKTPVFPILVQVSILLLVLIWAQNRRFGKPVALDIAVVDNSEAYIQALAGVLQKADTTKFVVEMVGKQEQLQLQKALGLGQVLLERETLINFWIEKTGASAAELDAVLKLQSRKQPISEQDLLSWLGKWRNIRLIRNS